MPDYYSIGAEGLSTPGEKYFICLPNSLQLSRFCAKLGKFPHKNAVVKNFTKSTKKNVEIY